MDHINETKPMIIEFHGHNHHQSVITEKVDKDEMDSLWDTSWLDPRRSLNPFESNRIVRTMSTGQCLLHLNLLATVSVVLLLCLPAGVWCGQLPVPSSYHHHSNHPSYSSSSSSPSSSGQHHYHNRLYPFERIQHRISVNSSSRANLTCVNCRLKLNRTEAEQLKLDAIKQQILSKLNLANRPNLSVGSGRFHLPRQVALDIIRKAKLDSGSRDRKRNQRQQKRHHRRNTVRSYGLDDQWPATRPFFNLTSEDGDEEESDEFNDDYFSKTSEIIAFAEPGRTINGHTLVDLLPPEDNLHKLSITNALLWVRLAVNRTELKRNPTIKRTKEGIYFDKPVTLYIFQVDNNTSSSSGRASIYPTPFFESNQTTGDRSSFQLLTKQRLHSPVRHGWIKIDLTRPARKWFAASAARQQALSLLIDCVGCNHLLEIDLRSSPPASQAVTASSHGHHLDRVGISSLRRKKDRRHFAPFVVITTRTKLRKRSRRHAYNCEDGIRQCCKQSLYVDFEELGWNDWIIFPKGYTANYCMGECVQLRTPDVLAYFHSHVLEEYRVKNPYASITPCCAPTKLSSISLIYFDQGGHIIKADLPKMVVDECGCT